MRNEWKYYKFKDLVIWSDKSKIKSGDGQQFGKYKLYVCSDSDIKRYGESIEQGEALIFGTGGKPSCHFEKDKFAYSTDCVVAKAKSKEISLKFYYYYFRQNKMGLLQETFSGSGLQHTSKKKIGDISVPMPSLERQLLIVNRIEELFSELDNGIDNLLRIKNQLLIYKEAVLESVFRNISGDKAVIKNVCLDIKVGIVIKPTQYYVDEDGVFAFRNSNVRRGYVDNHEWVMISKDGHLKNLRSEVHTNDVLISRSGANLGMATAISEKYDGYNAIDVVIAVPNTNVINPIFLAHYTNSPLGKMSVKEKERGAAQGHLNVTAYGQLPIIVPSIEDQLKSIELIDAKFSLCDSIEQEVNNALLQAEMLRQSILKQAFEGRLI